MSRELDARVAVEVMGIELLVCRHEWRYAEDEKDEGYGGFTGWVCDTCSPALYRSERGDDEWWSIPKRYSTSIADAWLVVEKMRGKVVLIFAYGGWSCRVMVRGREMSFHAATAPEAICLAALAAVGQT